MYSCLKKGKMSRSLLITQKYFVIEKNEIGTKKMIARFIEESEKTTKSYARIKI